MYWIEKNKYIVFNFSFTLRFAGKLYGILHLFKIKIIIIIFKILCLRAYIHKKALFVLDFYSVSRKGYWCMLRNLKALSTCCFNFISFSKKMCCYLNEMVLQFKESCQHIYCIVGNIQNIVGLGQKNVEELCNTRPFLTWIHYHFLRWQFFGFLFGKSQNFIKFLLKPIFNI